MSTEKIKSLKKPKGSSTASLLNKEIAIVRLRGTTKVRHDIKKSLDLIGLKKRNSVTIRKTDAVLIGILNVIKDFCAFGEISEQSKTALKGKSSLNSPKGGIGSVKKSFVRGGALGIRSDMDKLIKSMIH